jgi:hypothetical protein
MALIAQIVLLCLMTDLPGAGERGAFLVLVDTHHFGQYRSNSRASSRPPLRGHVMGLLPSKTAPTT